MASNSLPPAAPVSQPLSAFWTPRPFSSKSIPPAPKPPAAHRSSFGVAAQFAYGCMLVIEVS